MAVAENKTIEQNEPGLLGTPVKTGIHLYQGTMAFIDATTGALTDVIASGANAFAGIVTAEADNTSGATGALYAETITNKDVVLTGSGFTQADVGKKVYATDNYAISLTATSRTLIGRAVGFISATQLRVRLEVGVNA